MERLRRWRFSLLHNANLIAPQLIVPLGMQVVLLIIVRTTPEHNEVKSLVPQLLTKHHAHHYIGFANNQWELFRKEPKPRVKPLLYAFRVLLTGIHLMRAHEIEANLGVLNALYKLPYIPELMARKIEGAEKETLDADETDRFHQEFLRLRDRLVTEAVATSLPDHNSARAALNDLLVRIRLNTAKPGTANIA